MNNRIWAALCCAALMMAALVAPAQAAPTVGAASAGSKVVGQMTFTWGKVSEPGERQVWTEVRKPDGSWSRSAQGLTKADGSYTLELTYGFTTVGSYTFRVGAQTSAGVVRSPEFTLQRTGWTPNTAGTKMVGEGTNVWGTVPLAARRTVWTEARLSNGAWSRSQSRTADGKGFFAVPLTYGINTPGDHTFRVAASTPRGVVYSQPFVLKRTVPTYDIQVSHADWKYLGEGTNAWGTVKNLKNGNVWTEAWLGDRWSVSQRGTTSSTGSFVLPLTYGTNTPGFTIYRIGAQTPTGTVYSDEFDLYRAYYADWEASDELLAALHAKRTAGATCGGQWMPPAPSFALSDELESIAFFHSNDMAVTGEITNTGPDGSTIADWIADAGYDVAAADLVVVGGKWTIQEAVDSIMADATSCRTIMNPALKEVGAAVILAENTAHQTYWSVALATVN